MKKDLSVYIVLLTWRRLPLLRKTLEALTNQTYKDFKIYITNGNIPRSVVVDRVANNYRQRGLDIEVSHDGNDMFAFRRFTVGRKLAERGADVILFIDDDISFTASYVENCLSHYEPKTYKSGFAWSFQEDGSDYYTHRTRHWDNNQTIHYCGTGVSMIDARIFLEDKLMDAPPEAFKIEDVWLSYYAQHVLKWKLEYMPMPDVTIGGADGVALYKEILRADYTKADFLRLLVSKYGWKLKK